MVIVFKIVISAPFNSLFIIVHFPPPKFLGVVKLLSLLRVVKFALFSQALYVVES